jgi:hypothetical protein
MPSLRENLDPASWDGETYFKYIDESRKLESSSNSLTRNAMKARPDRVRLGAINTAIKKYEKAAFQRQIRQTDIERG